MGQFQLDTNTAEFLFHMVGYLTDLEGFLKDAHAHYNWDKEMILGFLETMESRYGGYSPIIEYVQNNFKWSEE
jgi:hypothetical protein